MNPPCFFPLLKIPNISIKESLLPCMLTSYSETPKAITVSVSGDVVGGRAWGGDSVVVVKYDCSICKKHFPLTVDKKHFAPSFHTSLFSATGVDGGIDVD